MPLFDIEPTSAYSGSYMAIVVTGSRNPTGTAYQQLISSSFRKSRVGDAASLAGALLYTGVTQYGEYSRLIVDNQAMNVNQRFVSHVSTTKVIYDSHIPDLAAIFLADNAYPAFTSYRSVAGPDIRVQFIFGTRDELGVLHRRTSSYASDANASISNDNWVNSSPFQYKYRNAPRRAGSFIDANGLLIRASTSFDVTGSVFDVTGIDTTGIGTAPNAKTLSALDPFAGGFSGTIPGATASFQVGFMDKNRNTASIWADYNFRPVEEYTDTDTTFSGLPAAFGTPISNNTKAGSNVDTIRAVYGFGDGPSNTPLPKDVFGVNRGHVLATYPIRVWFGTGIRGWKYGLYNGLPTSPKCIFRRNHFGSHRDMLEQRLFTKEVNKINGTLEAAVTLSFISGSEAYVTASNPALNTREVGYYDFEYKCGIPWKDR
jgi:hypothetical protein